MKITTELLRKYLQGHCNESETLAVKLWLEDVAEETSRFAAPEMAGIKAEMWQEIATVLPGRIHESAPRRRKTSGMFDQLAPFLRLERAWPIPAAACLLFAVFLSGFFTGGHLQASEMNAVQMRTYPTEALVVHNQEKRTVMNGQEFSFLFEGTLRLSNTSGIPQIIRFSRGSDTAFTLKAGRSYFLVGSHESPRLIESTSLLNDDLESMPRSYATFTITAKPAS